MTIKFRTYTPGDEQELANLFNICFNRSGPGFHRTPETILWRYIYRPNAHSTDVQIAENQAGKIVGAVYSTIEDYDFGEKCKKVGAINDVSVDPDYTKLGIARNLIEQAIVYFQKNKCDLAILSADPKEFPYNKLYQPLGWQDYCKIKLSYSLFPSIVRYFPLFFGFFPIFMIGRLFQALFYNYYHRHLRSHSICDISFTVNDSNQQQFSQILEELRTFYNTEMPKKYEGKVHFSKDEWFHFRMSSINGEINPSYIIIYYKDKIIGYTSFFKQWIHFRKIKHHIPLAIVREFIISKDRVKEFHLNYSKTFHFLRLALQKEAQHQDCGTLILPFAENDRDFLRRFALSGFISIKPIQIMMKSFNSEIPSFETSEKSFKVSAGEIFLFP